MMAGPSAMASCFVMFACASRPPRAARRVISRSAQGRADAQRTARPRRIDCCQQREVRS